MNKFYITSAIPYVNAKPHIGWATEIIQADTIARFHTLQGEQVCFLCGSDENALKNVQAAEKSGKSAQEFVDENAKSFEDLSKALIIGLDVFQKGSTPNHHVSSQKLWELCDKAGDIYKKSYKGLYCVGCEQFYTRDELNENGECFEHPGKQLEEVEEENYFFRLSKYQTQLTTLLNSNEYEIVPAHRKNEMLSFLKKPLQDISISRSNQRAKNWGVPVPGDPNQRIYVWFDALNIYQSGIGFGWDEKRYQKWWPADVHVIGKGIIRFHAIYWPAILLSAGLKLPKKLFVHEYLTVNGQKISKSLGNAVDPLPLVEQYGADAIRYYCLAKVSPFSDGDFSLEKLKESYNSDLANGLGNVVSRVAKLCELAQQKNTASSKNRTHLVQIEEYSQAFSEFKFNEALAFVWRKISALDKFINDEKPWELIKTNNPRLKEVLAHGIDQIQEIAVLLEPFLPQTAQKIQDQFSSKEIKSQPSLFPRIQ